MCMIIRVVVVVSYANLNFQAGLYTNLLSITNFSSKLLNCFLLKILFSKTKQSRSLLLKLVIVNMFIHGPGLALIRIYTSIRSFS